MFNILFTLIFTDHRHTKKRLRMYVFNYRSNFILLAKLWKTEKFTNNPKSSP